MIVTIADRFVVQGNEVVADVAGPLLLRPAGGQRPRALRRRPAALLVAVPLQRRRRSRRQAAASTAATCAPKAISRSAPTGAARSACRWSVDDERPRLSRAHRRAGHRRQRPRGQRRRPRARHLRLVPGRRPPRSVHGPARRHRDALRPDARLHRRGAPRRAGPGAGRTPRLRRRLLQRADGHASQRDHRAAPTPPASSRHRCARRSVRAATASRSSPARASATSATTPGCGCRARREYAGQRPATSTSSCWPTSARYAPGDTARIVVRGRDVVGPGAADQGGPARVVAPGGAARPSPARSRFRSTEGDHRRRLRQRGAAARRPAAAGGAAAGGAAGLAHAADRPDAGPAGGQAAGTGQLRRAGDRRRRPAGAGQRQPGGDRRGGLRREGRRHARIRPASSTAASTRGWHGVLARLPLHRATRAPTSCGWRRGAGGRCRSPTSRPTGWPSRRCARSSPTPSTGWPSLVTDAEGRGRIAVRYPDTLTTWRLTARAVTTDTRVGVGVARTTTTKDLIVRLVTPRFLTEGDDGADADHRPQLRRRRPRDPRRGDGDRRDHRAAPRRRSPAPSTPTASAATPGATPPRPPDARCSPPRPHRHRPRRASS